MGVCEHSPLSLLSSEQGTRHHSSGCVPLHRLLHLPESKAFDKQFYHDLDIRSTFLISVTHVIPNSLVSTSYTHLNWQKLSANLHACNSVHIQRSLLSHTTMSYNLCCSQTN